jgi:YVTN family beta-propeller protein
MPNRPGSKLLHTAIFAGALAGCTNAPPAALAAPTDAPRLPTGVRLDPAGPRTDVGALPLTAVLSPDSAHILLLLNGWRQQGVQVVNRRTGAVTQTVDQPAAFIGLTFSPDGRTVYASGGNADVVYRYDWASSRLTLRDSMVLHVRQNPRSNGSSYPAGIATSADGRFLYVAENLADSLAVLDVATGSVVQRFAAGRYPYGVTVGPDGTVYVSSWGTQAIHVFARSGDSMSALSPISVGRHPSTLLLNADGSRLFATSASTDAISVIDTKSRRVVSTLRDPTPANLGQGSAPNGMLLARDGTQLYVTEGDNNAVALFALSARTAGVGSGTTDSLLGRAPVGWYPASVVMVADTLHVIDAKGRGTAPNPKLPQPDGRGNAADRATSYTAGQINGTITRLATAMFEQPSLSALSGRVARANNWDAPAAKTGLPPIRHVIYIIKENRTYDQVFSDMPQGDGDTTLLFFPRNVSSPNHHALAERFGLFDRFFVNAEVSADGHNWSTAAYTTDYTQKTVPSNYSDRGRSYDYEGTNRGRVPADDGDDDVAEPANGYLWDLAQRKGLTFRNFGEFVAPDGVRGDAPEGYRGVKPFLIANTSKDFPGYNLDIQDQRRADVYLRELQGFVASGVMPQLQILRLPNDHTSGASANKPTPQAHFADNDLALGRIVDAMSKTTFWESTAIFVLEDDAQAGPDHVDSHRSLLLVVSPWARSGAHHRFVNTTDVIATMEALLGLDALSPFDHYGRPLREIWRNSPDTRPYAAITPAQALTEKNPARGTGAIESRKLDLRYEDVAEEDLFNRILWYTIKGTAVRYPGPTRMSAAEVLRSW